MIQAKRMCYNMFTIQRALFGEMVDNRIMTRAAEEVQRADVLLVLVNAVPHFSDRLADISINDRVDNTLEKILKELGD